ncbi:MAG: hypothetical protein M0008_03995 [Actinomycetota bacterium]|jgi:hypothetical protein|nr:hypothetical protein [Actinomycetota bacterium]
MRESEHNFEAWLQELAHRHGASAGAIEIRSGEPSNIIMQRSQSAALLVLVCRDDPSPGRCDLAKALIERAKVSILLPALSDHSRRCWH